MSNITNILLTNGSLLSYVTKSLHRIDNGHLYYVYLACLLCLIASFLPLTISCFLTEPYLHSFYLNISNHLNCSFSHSHFTLILILPWLRWQKICLQCRRGGFSPWVGKINWRKEWQPSPVFLPRESHGLRSLAGYSLQRHEELDMTD